MFSEGRGKGIWRNYVVNQRILNLTKLLDNTILVKDKKSLHKKDGRPSSSISLFSEQPTTKLIPFPLSGRGAEIQYTGNLKGGFSCKWGSQYIELKPDFLQDILNNFSGRGEVKLGAEQGGSGGTGSFGIWLNDKHNLNPRFASVIAALLVNEGLVTSRGKNPIYLNFI